MIVVLFTFRAIRTLVFDELQISVCMCVCMYRRASQQVWAPQPKSTTKTFADKQWKLQLRSWMIKTIYRDKSDIEAIANAIETQYQNPFNLYDVHINLSTLLPSKLRQRKWNLLLETC